MQVRAEHADGRRGLLQCGGAREGHVHQAVSARPQQTPLDVQRSGPEPRLPRCRSVLHPGLLPAPIRRGADAGLDQGTLDYHHATGGGGAAGDFAGNTRSVLINGKSFVLKRASSGHYILP